MIYKTDEDWMKIALKYARIAEQNNEIPIGAILILEERIVGIGWNSSITNNDPTAHAEIVALRYAGKKIKNYRLINTTLYVTLQPCIMCCGAIINSRIKRLVFGAHYKKIDKKCSLKNIFSNSTKDYKLEITNSIMKSECSDILVNFFYQKRKNKKI